ncbi:hypothetical protein SAMN04488005_0310 [Yoonia tamlensis]|uniref:Uncharacterized protein n=1 Tax=Yoonia tamlensis TaxID=390270 RepID=A0A1I6FRB0_9RHOB|nr:hypothetical protein [Yoonia tamlensis]SFR32444.1 hypothetical protein SAMN04488005_0310 [Yoonia tamlensis]
MAQAHVPFDKRLKRIVRRHERMANGVVKTVTADGLIVARPRVYRPRFPLKGLLALVVTGFLFKGFLLAALGAEAYADRVAGLRDGSFVEKAGAWVMQPDVATMLIAEQVKVIMP